MYVSLCLPLSIGGETTIKMEVKTSLLDNMIGVGDMVLLEPLSEDSFLENLKKRFDHNEIYVSVCKSLPTPLPLMFVWVALSRATVSETCRSCVFKLKRWHLSFPLHRRRDMLQLFTALTYADGKTLHKSISVF